jgi:3-keto-disaccharide hydrolase
MPRPFLLAVCCVFAFPLLAAAQDKKPDEGGFVTIFDGKSLDGWKKAAENEDSIQLQDGAIVAHGNRSHLFYVGDEKPFKNFHFQCEVMTKANSNGGIYFHTKYQDKNWPAQGHECQVNNSYKPDPQKTGGVYKVAQVLEAPAKDDEWFKYEIIAQGNHIVIKINDKVTADYTEDPEKLAKMKGMEPGRRVGEGTFALQAHDPGSTVLYRNIRVKRLP